MILKRFRTPASVELHIPQDSYFRSTLLPLAAHGDGHVLAVTVALLLALLTGRSDLCVAGVLGAGKTRSLAVLLVALQSLQCALPTFHAVVFTNCRAPLGTH